MVNTIRKKKTSKQKPKKNATTRRKRDLSKVLVLKRGNIIIAYKTPYLHGYNADPIPKCNMQGGASIMETNLNDIIFKQIPKEVKDEKIVSFVKKQKKSFVTDMIPKIVSESLKTDLNKPNATIVDKPGQLNALGQKMVAYLKQSISTGELLNAISNRMKNIKSPEDIDTFVKYLNEPPPSVKGKITEMSAKTFDKMSEGAASIGSFLSPKVEVDPNRRRENDTSIQLLWYPRSNIHYRKGNSTAVPKDKIKYGDFMIYIEPERYADISAYFADTTNSVEDLFTNILNGCSDALCLKGEPVRQPYKKQVLEISNLQPDFDDKEMQKTSLSV